MLKKGFIYILFSILIFSYQAKADEGMWLLSLINKNYEEMKALGLKLSPEDIYNINNACLKDAIGGLSNSQYFRMGGFFCTGEIISDKGLMLTNHHCGYELIQEHSTVEHDYLRDGFWAKSLDEELMNPDLTVSFLVRMEDVTAKVLADVTDDMDEKTREDKINKAINNIKSEAEKDNDYDVFVKSMFEGNQYFLFVYITYKDVRLVGAPPESIGKFGSDTDNWMWPRHTGDFSLFRVYTAPDGKPAEYSKDNIPLKPKHFLPISIAGVKKNDFAMVLGYPGSTDRYMTSYGIKETVNSSNPIRIKVRTRKLEIMKENMDKDQAVRIKLASKYAQSANYWKYSIGQNKGLKRLKVYDERVELENKLVNWINSDPARKEKYGNPFDIIKQSYEGKDEINNVYNYVLEALLQGPEITMFCVPIKFQGFYSVVSKGDEKTIKDMAAEMKESGEKFYKDYDAPTDMRLLAELTKMYYENVPEAYHLEVFKTIEKKYKGDFNKWAQDVFDKSVFTSKDKYFAFLDKPSTKILDKDPVYQLMEEVIGMYFKVNGEIGKSSDFSKARRLYLAALLDMEKDKLHYPDANSTIRLTYGTVGDYSPMDAVYYNYFTTLKGVMEKDDPEVDEFRVDPKLKELFNKKDFGKYADGDGTMHVCFTTNNDITGGNSGSPVINGKGELIGTAFDGNWEAMSGDIRYEKDIQKCICVDIRYVLFVIDKFAGATNLIDEMNIVE
ncbi:MAG: S46 family peptidase [Marinilabiliales bacterium]